MCIKFNCTHCGNQPNRTSISKKFRTKNMNIGKLNEKLKTEEVECPNCHQKGGLVAIKADHRKVWKGKGQTVIKEKTRVIMRKTG